jgi:hypothetical protein
MKFSQFISKWATFKPLELQVEALDNDEIIEANQNQLEQGLKSDGSSFEPYSPVTLAIKMRDGGFISQSGNLAMKDTGAFFRSMVVRKERLFAEMGATDSKTEMLTLAHGDTILGVPENAKQDLIDSSRDKFIELCEKHLGL